MGTEAVLFDLGGVLVHGVGAEVIRRWLDEESEEAVWRRWLSCPWVRRYERGECSTREFARGMVETWGFEMQPDEFLEQFRAFPRGLFPGARALVENVTPGTRRACFSNTNELHWSDQAEGFGLATLFDQRFLSFEMGLVKPDREAYGYVVDALDLRPDQVLFLDDNEINVEGARAVGLDAHRTVGVDAARDLLRDRGLHP